MQEYGVYRVMPLSQAFGGRHVYTKVIASMRKGKVRWRLCATQVNDGVRDDVHSGTPGLQVARIILSKAASSTPVCGVRVRMIGTFDVRKAYFNADIDEKIFVHPGRLLSPTTLVWTTCKKCSRLHLKLLLCLGLAPEEQ